MTAANRAAVPAAAGLPLGPRPACGGPPERGTPSGDLNADGTLALVANTPGGLFGLSVDAIESRVEVLVKLRQEILVGVPGAPGVPGVLGTSLRADGSVLIVLDPREVIRAS